MVAFDTCVLIGGCYQRCCCRWSLSFLVGGNCLFKTNWLVIGSVLVHSLSRPQFVDYATRFNGCVSDDAGADGALHTHESGAQPVQCFLWTAWLFEKRLDLEALQHGTLDISWCTFKSLLREFSALPVIRGALMIYGLFHIENLGRNN